MTGKHEDVQTLVDPLHVPAHPQETNTICLGAGNKLRERTPGRATAIVTSVPAGADGRVFQLNVSAAGVPKRPVDWAWVGPPGVEGDRQRHDTAHGGPHRAVALLALEAIERVPSEDHPIEPGRVCENLTTTGIELARLAVGTRLVIGDRLVLQMSAPAYPCNLIKGSFRDGKSGRISILTHPADSPRPTGPSSS